MRRLKAFKEVLSVVGVPLSALAGKEGEAYLATLSLPPALRFGLAVILIIVVYLCIRRSADWVLSWRWFRRWIAGRYDVEGTWMDVVRQRGEVIYVGVLRVSVEREQLRITGENYGADGLLQDSFNSEQVALDWPVVTFTYTADRRATGNPESRGFSRIRFAERNGPPTRYKGFFQDTSGRRGDYGGWRVARREELARVDDPREIGGIVRGIVAREPQATAGDRRTAEAPGPGAEGGA